MQDVLTQQQSGRLAISETKTVELLTTAPVFIGSGEEINQTLYFHDKQKRNVYIANEGKILSRSPAIREKYKALIMSVANHKTEQRGKEEQASLKNIITNFRQEPTDLCDEFFTDEPGKITGDIQLFQSNHEGCYIPGSSIKGAIRTLVLNHLLRHSDKKDFYQQQLKNSQSKDLAKQIEDALLRCFHKQGERSSMLTDLFRAVRISDSQRIDDENFEIIEAATLNFEKKQNERPQQQRPAQQRQQQPRPEDQKMKIIQQCLSANTPVQFYISLDLNLLAQFDDKNHPVPFKTVEELLRICATEATALKNSFSKMQHLYKTSTEDSQQYPDLPKANFYVGGNTGFDRHTVWPVLDDQSTQMTAAKKKTLKGYRDNDICAPRCQRAQDLGKNDSGENEYLSYGWCHLKVVQ
jgi:CRISPR-associated protein Csm5